MRCWAACGGLIHARHAAEREIDSLSSDGAQLVASLLARIDGLMTQIAARDDRIDELLSQVKALNARIAELEAKRGGPPKTPDNSSLPPSRGQKAAGQHVGDGTLRNCEAEEALADLGEPAWSRSSGSRAGRRSSTRCPDRTACLRA
jgi:hypothetical protein